MKGNKKKAEAFLTEQRKAFEIPEEDVSSAASDELFADYLERWLQIAKGTIAITTYSSYERMLRYPLLPWFREKGVTLKGLTARHIQDFYSAQMKRVKPNTVIHYHAVIHRALKYAVKTDLLAAADLKRQLPQNRRIAVEYTDMIKNQHHLRLFSDK